MKQDAERLLAGELSYLDYAAACAAEDARCADLVSDAPYWAMLQRARDEGKKIIYVSGPAPVELIYAFDCVPMSFDLLTPRLSENAALIPPLMRGYLRLGARVCGQPAHDPEFGVGDFPALLDKRSADVRYLRRLRSVSAAGQMAEAMVERGVAS